MSRRQRSSRHSGIHPTYARILAQAVQVLEEDDFDRFSVQRVLDSAEVSRATLYNHFTDVDTLIEAALVEVFARESAAILDRFVGLTERSTDRTSFLEAVTDYIEMHGQIPAKVRMRRAHTISLSTTRPALAAAVAEAQDDVTDAWQATIEGAQRRGYVRADLDARTVAAMIQAIPLGRIVDDAASESVGSDRWTAMVVDIVERTFIAPED